MWNLYIVAPFVAIVGASVVAFFSRPWIIGAIAFGFGTPFAVAIGDEILKGKHNRFIAVVILFASFLTVPAAFLAGYFTHRLRHSGRDSE